MANVKSSDPARYADYCEVVRGPGKFEGCLPYAPYYWEIGLDGFADVDDGRTWRFRVDADDRALFPELKGRQWVALYESDSGFVYEL